MEDLIPLFAIFFVIGVPVMSIAAKFVLQPLLRELTGAIRGGQAKDFQEMQERVARLEGHLIGQAERLDQLFEAEQFRRQLEAGRGGATIGAPEPPIPNWTAADL
jgi:hypothetical protein